MLHEHQLFIGQKETLAKLRESLKFNNKVILFSGETGVGKTETLNFLINNSKDKYNYIQFGSKSISLHEDFYVIKNTIEEQNKTHENFRTLFLAATTDIPLVGNTLSALLSILILKNNQTHIFKDDEYLEVYSALEKQMQSEKNILVFDMISYYDSKSLNFLKTLVINHEKVKNLEAIILVTNPFNDSEFLHWLDAKNINHDYIKLERPLKDELIRYVNDKYLVDVSVENGSENLLNLSEGDIGLINIFYQILSISDLNDSVSISKLKTEMGNIIDKKISRLEDSEIVEKILKIGACIGIEFNQRDIIYVLNEDRYKIITALEDISSLNITHSIMDELYKFTHAIVHTLFLDKINNSKEKVKYYDLLIRWLSKFKPEDYYLRAEYTRGIGETIKSSEYMILHQLSKIRKSEYVENTVITGIHASHKDYLHKMTEAYSHYFNREYKKCLIELNQLSDPFIDILEFEKEYLIAISAKKIPNQYVDMKRVKVSLEYFCEVLSNEQELWIRCASTLIALYFDYFNERDKAIHLHKKLISVLAESAKSSEFAQKYLHIMKRKASILFVTEVAVEQTLASVLYFRNTSEIRQYSYSICNHSGNLICLGRYQEAFEHLSSYISECKVLFSNSNYIINNTVLAGVYSNNLQIDEGLKLLGDILTSTNGEDQILIQNNLNVLISLTGDFSKAEINYVSLLESETVRKDDYYEYLIIMNLISTFIMQRKFKEAMSYFSSIKENIPHISEYDRIFLERRSNKINEIIENQINVPYSEFDNYLINHSEDFMENAWRHWGRLFLTSDLQVWSES